MTAGKRGAPKPAVMSPMSNEWFSEDFGERLASILSPLYIAVGDLDFAYKPALSLAALIPTAQLTVLTGADHSAYLQSIDEFLTVVQAALAAAFT